MNKFKDGDKVYIPMLSTKVLVVTINAPWRKEPYPIDIFSTTFTIDGKIREEDKLPMIFPATEENHALLEKLYGVKFEAPPVKPTSRDIIQALLNSGQKYVPCYVSSDIMAPNGGSYLDFIVWVHNDGRFYNKHGEGWKYATPFDPKTGEPITEMPGGVS